MRRSFGYFIALLALVYSCQFPGCGSGPLVVSPDSVRPGNLLHLHQERGRFQAYDSLRVVVGGFPAYVTRIISNTDLDVLVPTQLPGTAEVRLQEGATVKATATVDVRPTDSVRVIMRMESNRVTLVEVEPSVDAAPGDVPSRKPRLSFDVRDLSGSVIYSTSILHPLQTPGESFARSASGAAATRQPSPSPAIFSVRIPNDPRTETMFVYEAEAGLDLSDQDDRDERVLLDSLTVKEQ